jgi:hypothetical protein
MTQEQKIIRAKVGLLSLYSRGWVARCAGLLAQRTTIDSRPYRRSRIGIRNELKLVNLVLGLRVVLSPPSQASILLMTEGGVNPPSKN